MGAGDRPTDYTWAALTGFILQAEVVGEAAQATIELATLLSFHKRENYRECDPIDPDSEDTL